MKPNVKYQIKDKFSIFVYKFNSRKLNEVPSISMVNFNLGWKELNFSNNLLKSVKSVCGADKTKSSTYLM